MSVSDEKQEQVLEYSRLQNDWQYQLDIQEMDVQYVQGHLERMLDGLRQSNSICYENLCDAIIVCPSGYWSIDYYEMKGPEELSIDLPFKNTFPLLPCPGSCCDGVMMPFYDHWNLLWYMHVSKTYDKIFVPVKTYDKIFVPVKTYDKLFVQ
jgi:hypothetical protein